MRDMVEDVDLGTWLEGMEKSCLSAGKLRSALNYDKQRVLRRMETLDLDNILTDIQPWLSLEVPILRSTPSNHQDCPVKTTGEGRGARHPINKPNSTPRQLEVGTVPEKINPRSISPTSVNNTHTRKKPSSRGEKSDWFQHLTGLVGW